MDQRREERHQVDEALLPHVQGQPDPVAVVRVGIQPGQLPASAGAAQEHVRHWSLTTLREKLVKIGAKVTRHSKYVTFQLAEVAVTRELFAAILDRIERLALPPPVVAGCDKSGPVAAGALDAGEICATTARSPAKNL